MSVPLSLRVAAVLLWVSGVGFGLPCLTAIRSLIAGHGVPRLFGFPAYGEGPFEQRGISTTVPLLLAFFLVCVFEVAAGVPLWSGRKVGALLSIGVIPFAAIFWWGFALPIPPLFALTRVALIALSWRSLT